MWADIVIFDPSTVHDRATFENPNQLSEGMEYVLVNGVPVIEEGKDDRQASGESAAGRRIRALRIMMGNRKSAIFTV